MISKACCALYEDGSWYRGLVVGIQSADSIEVCFYMYVKNTILHPGHLSRLHLNAGHKSGM